MITRLVDNRVGSHIQVCMVKSLLGSRTSEEWITLWRLQFRVNGPFRIPTICLLPPAFTLVCHVSWNHSNSPVLVSQRNLLDGLGNGLRAAAARWEKLTSDKRAITHGITVERRARGCWSGGHERSATPRSEREFALSPRTVSIHRRRGYGRGGGSNPCQGRDGALLLPWQ